MLSVRQLIYEFEHDVDDDYSKMFKAHSYVGMINYDQVLIQYETCLLLVNVYPLLYEYIYQQVMYNFQNFGKFTFSEPLCLKELLSAGLDHPLCNYTEREHKDKEELVNHYFMKLSNSTDDKFI